MLHNPTYHTARVLLRTASAHSNIDDSTAAAGTATTATPVSSRPVASSSSTPLLHSASESLVPEGSARAEEVGNADYANSVAAGVPHQEPQPPHELEGSGDTPASTANGEEKPSSPATTAPSTNDTGAPTTKPPKAARGKKKHLGDVNHEGSGSVGSSISTVGASSKKVGTVAAGASSKRERTAGTHHDGAKHHGGGGRGGKGKGHHAAGGDSPEKHAARNLEIFEQNLAGLSLPKGATGKGAGGGR